MQRCLNYIFGRESELSRAFAAYLQRFALALFHDLLTAHFPLELILDLWRFFLHMRIEPLTSPRLTILDLALDPAPRMRGLCLLQDCLPPLQDLSILTSKARSWRHKIQASVVPMVVVLVHKLFQPLTTVL